MDDLTLSSVSLPQVVTSNSSNETSSSTATSQSISNHQTSFTNSQSYKKALHQAILLKARNPFETTSQANTSPSLSSSLFNCTMPALAKPSSPAPSLYSHQPKWTNVNNLVTMSNSTSNLININLNSTGNSTNSSTTTKTEEDHTDLLNLATSQLFSQLNDELNLNCTQNPAPVVSSDNEELDSPINIKENITSSIRNLKQTLDPLRSSTSDDEDIFTDNSTQNNRMKSSEIVTNNSDVIVIGSLLPNVNNNVVKLAIPLNNKNNYVKQASSTNINIPKLPAATNIPIKNINLSSISLLSSNNLNNQLAGLKSKNNNRIGKRLKDEALSNSSSSDEEDQQQQSRQKLCDSGHKLQHVISGNISNKQTISAPRTNTNLLNLPHTNSNQAQQPKITPVVSAAASIAAAAERAAQSNQSDQIICSSPSYLLNQSLESTTSDFTNSSYSSKSSQKSSQSSIDSPDLSFSCVASPTSCCSSSSTSANNDSAIDLHDDNSSTASGPIYIRQPGFEHHAHEVQLDESLFKSLDFTTSLAANTHISSIKPQKPVKKINEKNISYLTSNAATSTTVTKTNNKAKKKLCMMINENVQDTHLKPISNKAKREPLPMRLRALPPSFWQQPNVQQNVSPSSMCLPPLFKNFEIGANMNETNFTTSDDSNKSDAVSNSREVKISPANTDLLFKLFDQVDQQKDSKKLIQIQQLKMNRMFKPNHSVKTQSLCKTLIKGEDPCIVDSVTEGLFPLLRLDSRMNPNSNESLQYLSHKTNVTSDCSLSSNGLSNSSPVISSSNGTNLNNSLPMLQFEQNYSQALSDVVAAL